MSISVRIWNALNKNMGYEPDPDGDAVTFKVLAPGKISLYFRKASDEEGANFGIHVDKNVNSNLRNNLKTELHNTAVGKNCSDVEEFTHDEFGTSLYCYITTLDDSIVDWVIATMEELERRVTFMINK